MTIAVSWLRQAGKHEELVFASDSRLRSFGSWDANPKIFQIERSDCAITFAGDTQYSYPLITQIQNFVKSYPKSQKRYQDIVDFKGHVLNMINRMLEFKSDFEVPEVRFLLGGYSWKRKRFFLWNMYFDKNIKRFVCAEVRTWKGIKNTRIISFIGDYHLEYRKRLIDLMRSKRKFVKGTFDMEPFEVLRDMLLENSFDDIGGPPQVLKVYEHMNRIPISIKWTIGDKETNTLLGRPLLEYENNLYPELNAETLEITKGQLFG